MRYPEGAGGTSGGVLSFLVGLLMFCGGGYLFLNSVIVSSGFHLGLPLYTWGWFRLTSGMVLVPFLFGVLVIFYNSRNVLGWLLAGLSLAAMFFGIVTSLSFTVRYMTLFDMLSILVLVAGGLGLLLRSLRPSDIRAAQASRLGR